MNEAQTRLELIDPALRAAGWGVVDGSRILVEFPINKGRLIGNNKRAIALSADYVLVYNNRRIAVIEAKARDKDYSDGVGQAKEYAEMLNIRLFYQWSTHLCNGYAGRFRGRNKCVSYSR